MEKNDDGHEQINLDNIESLTIKNGELYWNKEKLKVETVQHFALSLWQGIGAVAVTLATVIGPVISYLANLEKICDATRNKAPLCPFSPPEKKAGSSIAAPSTPAQ